MHSPPAEKVCCKCGVDLTGKKRLKDSLGYWCPECHKEDQKSKEVQGVKCDQCGRIVPEKSLSNSDGKRVCSRCFREDRALRAPGSKRFRPIDQKNFQESDKKSVIILASVLGLLALIILISWFFH
jgi:DNA-directed RNA polymerase subunit RPC12/RpoP